MNGGGGTITDVDGVFTIVRKKPEQRKLIFSYTGYASDTVDVEEKTNIEVAMRAVGEMLNVVEIKERMKSNYLSKMSLEQKEIISSEGLKHLACCNLGESFENSASVDVGYSDAVSGSKQIQLLGLTGVYSQLLLENMPFLRGLSAPFGLGYVPGNWMGLERVKELLRNYPGFYKSKNCQGTAPKLKELRNFLEQLRQNNN